EVLISGSVWPQLKRPHSGWPYLPQPCGSLIRASISLQPIGLFGQPSASAIGFHIEMTTGVSTSGLADLAMLALPLSCLSTSSHVEADGDQIVTLSWPFLIWVRAAPLDTLLPSTKTGLPLIWVFVSLKA